MTRNPWTDALTALHATEHRVVLAVTGGGSKAISQLLEVPGASRTLLEAAVPYSSASLEHWLGGKVEQASSEATARAMATAWMRARDLAPGEEPANLIGAAATASLASDRPKRGAHRVYAATHSTCTTTSYSLELRKDERDRKKEEWIAAKLLIGALARACGVDVDEAERALVAQLFEDESVIVRCQQAEPAWTELLLGQRDWVACPAPGVADWQPRVVFPGAFNPPHQGHSAMARLAGDRLGSPACYELSITNVDKPPLDFCEIRQRLDALRRLDAQGVVLLTNATTFCEKAALFPGCTFVVGADTIARIDDVAYYGGDIAAREAAIEHVAAQNCRFLVFGRQIRGSFRCLGDLEIGGRLRALCDEVTADEFRDDTSSTRLRRRDLSRNGSS